MNDGSSRRDVLLALYAPAVILSFCRGLVLPILPFLALSLQVSYGMVGVVLAAQWIGTLISDIPAGIVIRRFGRKRIMVIGTALVAISALALVWARGLPDIVVCRFVSGVGMALWNISRHAFLADAFEVGQRGRASATMGGIARITAFAGPLLGGILGEVLGLRAPFLLYAVLAVAALAAAVRWVPSDVPEEAGPAEADSPPDGMLRRFLAVARSEARILAAAGSGVVMAQMTRAGRNAIVPLFAAEMLGLEESAVGFVISVSYAVEMPMFYPAGWIMDRFGRKFAYVPSFAVQALGMALLPSATGFAGLLAAVMVIGLGNGIGAGTMLTLGSDLAPRHARGEFLGIWRSIGDGGHAGGPLVVGRVADAIGLGPTPYIIAVFGLAGAALLGLLVPETLTSHQENASPQEAGHEGT